MTLAPQLLTKVCFLAPALLDYATNNKHFVPFAQLYSFTGLAQRGTASCFFANLELLGYYYVLQDY